MKSLDDLIPELEKMAHEMDTRKYVGYSGIPRGMYTTPWWAIQELERLKRELLEKEKEFLKQKIEKDFWKDSYKDLMKEKIKQDCEERKGL